MLLPGTAGEQQWGEIKFQCLNIGLELDRLYM
jgi:hypothetical protein